MIQKGYVCPGVYIYFMKLMHIKPYEGNDLEVESSPLQESGLTSFWVLGLKSQNCSSKTVVNTTSSRHHERT